MRLHNQSNQISNGLFGSQQNKCHKNYAKLTTHK